MKFQPLFTTAGSLWDSENTPISPPGHESLEQLQRIPSKFSDAFIRYHAQREIQIIEFQFQHNYAIQSINILNVASGCFRVIIADGVATECIFLNVSRSGIERALQTAVSVLASYASLPKIPIFQVAIDSQSPTALQFKVTFVVELENIWLLSIDSSALIGKIPQSLNDLCNFSHNYSF